MISSKIQSHTMNLLFLIATVFSLYILKPVVVPLLVAAILSVAIFPLVSFFEVRLKFNRLFSSLISITLLLIATALDEFNNLMQQMINFIFVELWKNYADD